MEPIWRTLEALLSNSTSMMKDCSTNPFVKIHKLLLKVFKLLSNMLRIKMVIKL
jgi:hypothetical protein